MLRQNLKQIFKLGRLNNTPKPIPPITPSPLPHRSRSPIPLGQRVTQVQPSWPDPLGCDPLGCDYYLSRQAQQKNDNVF